MYVAGSCLASTMVDCAPVVAGLTICICCFCLSNPSVSERDGGRENPDRPTGCYGGMARSHCQRRAQVCDLSWWLVEVTLALSAARPGHRWMAVRAGGRVGPRPRISCVGAPSGFGVLTCVHAVFVVVCDDGTAATQADDMGVHLGGPASATMMWCSVQGEKIRCTHDAM